MGIKFERAPETKDEIQCECAVMGIVGTGNAARLVRDGLHIMQHRGQEATGIATTFMLNHQVLVVVKKLGLAMEAITEDDLSKTLEGNLAIGHNRYSTAGASDLINSQPHISADPPIAFCANGDIIQNNYDLMRDFISKKGVYFNCRNDSELTVKLIAYYIQQGQPYIEAIQRVQDELVGSYSALMLYEGKLIAFRDIHGIRPLVFGKTSTGWAIASETCALDAVGAKYVRDVEAGEILVFDRNERPVSYKAIKPQTPAHCVFELIYFSRPDCIYEGIHVGLYRKYLGALLAQKNMVEADITIPVPDSSNDAALGFARESGIPFEFALRRNHYEGRSFIKPKQSQRDDTVRRKLNPDATIVKGKRIIEVDDSIVRGTTNRRIAKMLKDAGAIEVHIRISSPPVTHSCYYGINTPTNTELIGANKSVDEIRDFIGADSLEYLTVDDLGDAIEKHGKCRNHFCYACFNGCYPTGTT